jgi:hypothetical protein
LSGVAGAELLDIIVDGIFTVRGSRLIVHEDCWISIEKLSGRQAAIRRASHGHCIHWVV